MNIGFDAKRAFSNKTGLGNYSRGIIHILNEFYPENNYFLFNPKKSKNSLFNFFKINQIVIEPQNFIYKRLSSLWRLFGINTCLIENKINIFHGLSAEIPFGIDKNIKKVVTIHDLIFLTHPHLYNFFDRKIYYLKSKYAVNKADKIITISEQTKSDCIQYLRADPEKIEVIYQGCQQAFKEKYTQNQFFDFKTKFKLPNEFILNVGTIEYRKNLLSIVKAIKNLDTKLVVVGQKKSYFKDVEKYIAENNLEGKVIFLQNLNNVELAMLYQLAKIFVFPSLYEGFGIPIIEALYSKTPVITSKGGCFPEAGGPSTIYIDPLNIAALENKIKLLLNDSNLCSIMARNGLKYAQDQFDDQIVSNKIMAVYQNLVLNKVLKFENQN